MTAPSAHWRNFLYRDTARHWHAFWCRWLPTGELKQRFHAERIFVPAEGGCDMSVVYHYEDERGTVREGPQCGPWRITEEQHSASDGLLHPSSTDMTTLLLPAGGPSAWCMKKTGTDLPCAVELFLHHGEHLRMSAGCIHSKTGDLFQLSVIREDARAAFPSPDWSSSTDATTTDAASLHAALIEAGAPITCTGFGHKISASLEQSEFSAEWQSTRMATTSETDAVLLCPDSIAIVSPSKRIEGQPFSSATAWWPSTAGASPTLYTIEAHWDTDGALSDLVYLRFEFPN